VKRVDAEFNRSRYSGKLKTMLSVSGVAISLQVHNVPVLARLGG
jgi:hypothetical protein